MKYEDRMENQIKYRYENAYDALDSIMRYEPTEFNCVGWDGDTSNQFGRDCVIEAIYKEIDDLEEMAIDYGIEL
jgi:hypothetical protein